VDKRVNFCVAHKNVFAGRMSYALCNANKLFAEYEYNLTPCETARLPWLQYICDG